MALQLIFGFNPCSISPSIYALSPPLLHPHPSTADFLPPQSLNPCYLRLSIPAPSTPQSLSSCSVIHSIPNFYQAKADPSIF